MAASRRTFVNDSKEGFVVLKDDWVMLLGGIIQSYSLPWNNKKLTIKPEYFNGEYGWHRLGVSDKPIFSGNHCKNTVFAITKIVAFDSGHVVVTSSQRTLSFRTDKVSGAIHDERVYEGDLALVPLNGRQFLLLNLQEKSTNLCIRDLQDEHLEIHHTISKSYGKCLEGKLEGNMLRLRFEKETFCFVIAHNTLRPVPAIPSHALSSLSMLAAPAAPSVPVVVPEGPQMTRTKSFP